MVKKETMRVIPKRSLSHLNLRSFIRKKQKTSPEACYEKKKSK
jgi:hypothetical protein